MVSAEAVERLANRPPTPPKDHDKDLDLDHDLDQALQFLDVDIESPTIKPAEQLLLAADTPTQPSPPSSQDNGTNHRSVKRVEFSPCVTTHDHQPTYSAIASASPVPRRFPSSKKLRPIKSILKSTLDQQTPTPDGCSSPAQDYFSISDPKTFPIMLDSVTKSLAAPSTAVRLDGYVTLNGALKAYEELPDVEAMRAKMLVLVQFMSRDISESAQRTGPIESGLTTQALKLATAILMTPALQDPFDERFQTLLVDRSIEVLEQDPVHKSIANHHMFLLATQRFSARVVTQAKAERILSSLTTIHERVSGNSVIASRLVIFQRLLEQAPSVMLTTIRDWIPHIFHGVLSSIKDVRGRAIDSGTQAAMTLGTSFQATKAIIDLFNTTTGEEDIYGLFFIARLSDMTSQRSLAECVPQIWSMIILFFRSRKRRLAKWNMFKDFLLVIQKCLNSNDIGIKFRATCAWNRLVYALNPDRETFEHESLVNMLRVPFVVAFDKKGNDKVTKEARNIALTGYCNLLHYVLRPSQPHEDLDFFWDAYVHNVLSKLLRAGGRDAKMACRVLKALFNSKSTVWDENAANKAPMLPEALPRLDPKWVRSRTQKILDLIGPSIALCLSQPGDGRGIISTPWREFMTSIAGAGSQEVRASMELRECLAHLMNFFGKIWTDASKNFKEQSDGLWIKGFASLVECSVELIGPIHFGEENLTRNQAEAFEAAPTPSHRTSKHHEIFQSSAVVLYGLFSQPPVSINPDADYYMVAKSILHQVCQGRSSRKWRLELIRQCSQAISTSKSARLWIIALQEVTDTLVDSSLDENMQESQRLAHLVRSAVTILASGLHFDDGEVDALPTVFELIGTMSQMLKQEAGDGGVALGLIEPVAEALLQQANRKISKRVFIQCSSRILQEGVFPRGRQQVDEARRLLWNTALPQSRQAAVDPFNHVYELVKTTISLAYESIDECASPLAGFVEVIQGFLVRTPASQFTSALRKMQLGISQIVKDDERRLSSNDTDLLKASSRILAFWRTILDRLKEQPSNKLILKALDTLFAAGLNSSHRDIINATVSFWDDTFGRLDSLEYPPGVELAIRRLRPLVELDLPNFPERPDESEPSPLSHLVESQEDIEVEETATPSNRQSKKRPQRLSAFKRVGPAPVSGSSPAPRQSRSKPVPKAKLKHDDSQVDFTAVEGSSPVAEVESQLLTEHQKEVMSRQRFETAQMYPDFSSSPAPRPANPKLAFSRLDFSGQGITNGGYATPTLEEHGPMDDYVTSSPTPKASKLQAAAAAVPTNAEGQEPQSDVDDADIDIPSSPPQVPDETDYGLESDIQIDQVVEAVENEAVPDTAATEQETTEAGVSTMADQSNVEQASRPRFRNKEAAETHLKGNPFLQRLRQGAEGRTSSDVYLDAQSDFSKDEDQIQEAKSADVHEESEQDLSRSTSSSPMHYSDSFSELPPAEEKSFVDQTTIGEELETAVAEGGVSRIEDSFAGFISAAAKSLHSSMDEASQDSSKSSGSRSKRKRNEEAETRSPVKRRKSNSPFKRIMSMFTSKSVEPEEEKEEETEDCIVVGSQVEQETTPQAEIAEETTVPASAPASVPATKARRGRGRPRKSNTPTTALAESPAPSTRTRGSKRRASAMDDGETSTVAETPAASKSRRVTRSQEGRTGESPVLTELQPRKTRGRKLKAVVIETSTEERAEREQFEEKTKEAVEKEQAGAETAQAGEETAQAEEQGQEQGQEQEEEVSQEAESQLQLEQEAAVARNRVIAKPRSIIDRLRGIIAECKTLVLGPQDERAFQDAMFELGKEVYGARKRYDHTGGN